MAAERAEPEQRLGEKRTKAEETKGTKARRSEKDEEQAMMLVASAHPGSYMHSSLLEVVDAWRGAQVCRATSTQTCFSYCQRDVRC